MKTRRLSATYPLLAFTLVLACHHSAIAQLPIIINEYNAVSNGDYLDKDSYSGTVAATRPEKEDKYFASLAELAMIEGSPEGIAAGTRDGRIEGNGGNWIELVVTVDHADVRGWQLEWSEEYDTDKSLSGPGGRRSGLITFSQDDLWSDLRAGTIITVSERQYIQVDTDFSDDPDDTEADVNDRLRTDNVPEEDVDYVIDLSTDTSFNPNADDWWIHVSTKHERDLAEPLITTEVFNPDDYLGDEPESGEFSVTNDAWEVSILDAASAVQLGPIGEEVISNDLWGGGGLNSNEVARLQVDPTSDPSGLTFAYEDGETSTFGQPNIWSDLTLEQDFTITRSWLLKGDYNQDGLVDLADYTVWRNHLGSPLWQADGNGSGVVDAGDYDIWKMHFGDNGALFGVGSAAVPEPGTLALLAWAGGLIGWRHRSRSAT